MKLDFRHYTRIDFHLHKFARVVANLPVVAAAAIGVASCLNAAHAGPIKPDAGFNWESSDVSGQKITGPASIKVRSKNRKTGEEKSKEIVVGAGGMVEIKDEKRKKGGAKVTAVIGDPLIFVEGSIDSGIGLFDITTSSIPELFTSSSPELTFVSGMFNAAFTLPGNQLEGLSCSSTQSDCESTFVSWTSTWVSIDPIGSVDEDGDGVIDLDLFLGTIELNGISEALPGLRPDIFEYSFLTPNTGVMGFTVVQEMVLGGDSFFGTVTKELQFSLVPEPTTIILLALGLVGISFGWKRA